MFSKGGGEALAKTCDVPFLGKGTLKYYKSGPLFWGHLWDYDKCPLNGHVPLIELTDARIMCSGAHIQGTH